MYEYSFLILLLPLLTFIVLGLAGMKMSHKTAGLIGTCSLGVVTILSYLKQMNAEGKPISNGMIIWI